MKLSFSLPSNCSSKSNKLCATVTRFEDDDEDEDHNDDSPKRKYLTEFDPSQTLGENGGKQIVIPPVENEDRARKKLKSLDLLLRSEHQSPALADLNLRESSDPGAAGVTVESFAAAVLRGYGWDEGRGIGKNAKEDVKVKQFKKRAWREGIGFPQ